MAHSWLCIVAVLFGCAVHSFSKEVMVWMPLERLHENIDVDLAEIHQLAGEGLVQAVSYEAYNLGPHSTLLNNTFLTQVGALLPASVKRIPMISTYHDQDPHRRSTDIEYCRQLFANPDPFFAAVVEASKAQPFQAVNFDFEAGNGTTLDGAHYASFLTAASRALHPHHIDTTADMASWSALWNFTLLGESALDIGITMDTYATSFHSFQTGLARAQAAFAPEHLAIGLITYGDAPLNETDVAMRFDALHKARVQRIAIWPCADVDRCTKIVPDFWIPYIRRFLQEDDKLP